MARSYETGYGKPPRENMFKRGQSGNPRGRHKGARNLKTELKEELEELILVREGGSEKTVSKLRAMLKSLIASAIKGNPRAAKVVLDMSDRLFDADGVNDADIDLTKEDREILETIFARVDENGRGQPLKLAEPKGGRRKK